MITAWTDHLENEEDKENFRHRVLSAKDVLDRLKAILDNAEEAVTKTEMDIKSYETNPSWAYAQAHKNGFKQCSNRIKTIISLDLGKEKNDPKHSRPRTSS